jgi:glycosyltransferase involved in cell wall biosynthesis
LKISVVIPTLLREDPRRYREGRLWLEAAIESVREQTILRENGSDPNITDLEIVVAIDASAFEISPARKSAIESAGPVIWIQSPGTGNAVTLNAAARAATGDILAFLDDDDLWHPAWLSVAIPLLSAYDFVSTSPAQMDLTGKSLGYRDFALPSTWIMRRAFWEKMNGLNESNALHPDTEFLGRLNAANARRVHLLDAASRKRQSDWLDQIAGHSDILGTRHPPLVICSRTPGGMSDRIKNDPVLLAASRKEYEAMIARFGAVPW